MSRPAQEILASLAPKEAGFAERVRKHRLGPMAFYLGMSDFREDYLASVAVSERRQVALDEIGEALQSQNVEAIPIKGVSYLGWLYPDPALRPMSDIDMLVRPSAHEQAAGVLTSIGYRPCTNMKGSRSRLHHATTFQRGRHYVDLHRNIVQPLRTSLDVDELFARAQGDRLSRVDSALVHFAHIARSELYVPALNYLDGALLLGELSAGERVELAQRAERYRMGQGVRLSVEMTRCMTSSMRLWTPVGLRARLMPPTGEILSREMPPRALQILRKLVLCDDLRSVLGLVSGALVERLSEQLAPS